MDANEVKEEEPILFADIKLIMDQFDTFGVHYCQDQARLLDCEEMIETQKEQLRLSCEAEERAQRRMVALEINLKEQQDVIDKFIKLSDENAKLMEQARLLRNDKMKMRSEMKALRENFQEREDNQNAAHKKEIADLKSLCETKALEARSDLDMYRAEFDMKRKEMETKFQALQKEKRAELAITMQICEDKVQNMNDQMSSLLYSHAQQAKEQSEHISIHQQRIIDLERKLMKTEIELRRKAAPPSSRAPPTSRSPPTSYRAAPPSRSPPTSYRAAPPSRSPPTSYGNNNAQSYRYNNNSVQQAPPTILKKTSNYSAAGTSWQQRSENNNTEGRGGRGRSNMQPLEFIDSDPPKKVTFRGPKKRKLYNPNDDDMY